jgi:hypothetical protein
MPGCDFPDFIRKLYSTLDADFLPMSATEIDPGKQPHQNPVQNFRKPYPFERGIPEENTGINVDYVDAYVYCFHD